LQEFVICSNKDAPASFCCTTYTHIEALPLQVRVQSLLE
jgi:hypothetical protein